MGRLALEKSKEEEPSGLLEATLYVLFVTRHYASVNMCIHLDKYAASEVE